MYVGVTEHLTATSIGGVPRVDISGHTEDQLGSRV